MPVVWVLVASGDELISEYPYSSFSDSDMIASSLYFCQSEAKAWLVLGKSSKSNLEEKCDTCSNTPGTFIYGRNGRLRYGYGKARELQNGAIG
jgi:hypothetical protein